MNFKNTILWFAAACALISAQSSGCASKKRTAETAPSGKARDLGFLQKKLADNMPRDVQRLSARAKIAVEQDGSTLHASANLIWVKDSMLWLNVKKFGIEGARALITRDSVWLINRLEKTWSVRSFEWLKAEYHLPQGFSLLENLIFAQPWFDPEIKFKADTTDGFQRIFGQNHRYSADYRLEDGPFWVRQMTFLEQKESNTVTFGFTDFRPSPEKGQFPYLRTIEAFTPENGVSRIEIELSNVEFNKPKDWRFEIPAHYERVD